MKKMRIMVLALMVLMAGLLPGMTLAAVTRYAVGLVHIPEKDGSQEKELQMPEIALLREYTVC